MDRVGPRDVGNPAHLHPVDGSGTAKPDRPNLTKVAIQKTCNFKKYYLVSKVKGCAKLRMYLEVVQRLSDVMYCHSTVDFASILNG
jgi:hypothetical protein